MSGSDHLLILGALVGVAVAVYLSNTGSTRTIAEKFVGSMGSVKLPVLWFVVDDYGVNSRRWIDFGARSSRDLNVGFLNVTRAACHKTQGGDFEVRELLGRQAVNAVIFAARGDVPREIERCPPALWRAWARAALMSTVGGLYLDGFSLCLGPSFLQSVQGTDSCVFGTDYNESRSSADAAYGFAAGWASGPALIGWNGLASAMAELIDAGPTGWTAAIARNQVAETTLKYLAPVAKAVRDAEWSRRADGRVIDNEDLFGRTPTDDVMPPANAIFVPLDRERIERELTYNWFLRLSPEQILDPESHFVWAELARR